MNGKNRHKDRWINRQYDLRMDRNRHEYRWTNRYMCETDKQMERKIVYMHGQMDKQMYIKILD